MEENKKNKMTNQEFELEKFRSKQGIGYTFIICATIISIIALIGGFWGADGYKNVGIAMAIGFVVMCFGAMVYFGR
jgi:hypothetical protein